MSSDQMEDVAPTGAGSAENGMQDNAANANSREAIMSREQAEKMNKDLKHYSYVPVVPKEEEPLPAKRQRKKINYKEIAQPSVVATPKKTTPKKGSSKSKKMVSPTANVAAAPAGMLVAQPAAATPEAPATDLERKKMELQAQLEAINRSLQDLGNQLQQTTPVGSKRKSPESTVKSTPTKKPTNRKTATPKVASDLAYTPVKSSPAKDKKGRPARERKKSIPGAFEVDEPAVKLSPSLKTCRRILLQLMAHHWAMPFNRPVDPVELQIPDYPLIIKNPMDLGTIKSKLDNGEYETVFEFSDDVHLTFNNAMTYNMPGSDVFVMADTLLKEFLKKFKTIERRQIEKTSNPYSPAYSDYGRKEVVPRGTPTKSGRIPKPKIKKNEPIPLSREEKVKLSATINKLPAESLVDVLHIIQQSMPQISDQAEEIEIDIDSLDTYTLRRLEKCVKNGMRKAKKVPKKKAAPPSRLEQAELAQMGTQQKIEDVQREIQALTNSEMALAVEAPAGTKSVKKGGDEDVVIDDDVQPSQYPPVVIDKEKSGSDSDSGSDSSTSSESGSDSNSDTESAQSPAVKSNKLSTGDTEVEAPQIISASATIKTVAIENAASWRSSLGSSAEDVENPLRVEPSMKATANLSWSQFQHKDNLMKQREREKQEREELLRKEKLRQEEERRKEEERKMREKEQDDLRRKEEELKQAEEEQRRKEEERLKFLQTLEKGDDDEEDDSGDMVMLKQLGAGSMSLDSMASLLSKSGSSLPGFAGMKSNGSNGH